MGYTYFAIIPTTEIIKQELPTIYTYLIVVLISLFSAYIALRSSKKIYAPIHHNKSVLSKHSSIQTSEKGNIFDQLIVLANDIKRSEDNSSHMISFAQEKYLINLLNSTDYYIDEALNDILDIILNFENEDDCQYITDIFKSLYTFLSADIECINLSVGQSGICSNLAGLKKCHDEARDSFIIYDEVRIETKLSSLRQETVLFDRNSEDELFIVLSSYNKKKIMEFIDDLKDKNSSLSIQSIKLLYNYIINTILKFIRINNIPYKEKLIDFEIVNDILKQPLDKISSDIEVMLDTIIYTNSAKTSKNDIHENVIKYIQDHFSHPEISISVLSDMFSLSDSQLSRIIISHTGFGFRDYINTKRIEKAKALLAETEKSIESIVDECGFTNPQTFRRVFKSVVGQTPSEYRQKHK